MLRLSNALIDVPIMSLRTTGMVATANQLIINPNNLKIEGWYCTDHFSKSALILLAKDVREIVPQGIAIDDYDVLTSPDELIRLKDVIKLNFVVIGKPVTTDQKRRVGKVSDFAVDTNSFYIKKLYISEPLYRNFSGGQLSIDRTQIVEITDKKITVRDVDQKAGVAMPAMGQAT